MRIFGKATTSNEYSTSKMYIDMYGNMYFAGYSTAWCTTTPANSMVVFKNNMDMDIWETHTNADVYQRQYINGCG